MCLRSFLIQPGAFRGTGFQLLIKCTAIEILQKVAVVGKWEDFALIKRLRVSDTCSQARGAAGSDARERPSERVGNENEECVCRAGIWVFYIAIVRTVIPCPSFFYLIPFLFLSMQKICLEKAFECLMRSPSFSPCRIRASAKRINVNVNIQCPTYDKLQTARENQVRFGINPAQIWYIILSRSRLQFNFCHVY